MERQQEVQRALQEDEPLDPLSLLNHCKPSMMASTTNDGSDDASIKRKSGWYQDYVIGRSGNEAELELLVDVLATEQSTGRGIALTRLRDGKHQCIYPDSRYKTIQVWAMIN